MRLEDLAKQTVELRDVLSRIVVNDPQYINALESGSLFFSSQELHDIEHHHQDQGLTLRQIQEKLAEKGMAVKLPTFKRYVGMKLVAGTTKILKTDTGSVGFYPCEVIRQINLIKYLLESKRDFLECYITSLGATPSNAQQIVESDDPDALDIVENLGDFRAYDVVKKHLEDMVKHKVITRSEKETVLSKARGFGRACDNLCRASGGLQEALEKLVIPGSYRLDKLFETVKKQMSGENKEQQEAN